MKKAITQGVLLLVITVIVGTFVSFQQAEYVKTRKEKAELISLSIATQVEEKINREIYITNLLDVLIRANAEEPFPAFHRAVSDILRFSCRRMESSKSWLLHRTAAWKADLFMPCPRRRWQPSFRFRGLSPAEWFAPWM